MTEGKTDIVLITIALSHYCEKARWALDRVGIRYREEPHAPLVHRLFTMAKGGATVPMLIDGSRRIVNSADILRYAAAVDRESLYPADAAAEVEAWEAMFDAQLGPCSRRWAYAHLLSNMTLICSLWTQRAPPIEAATIRILAPFIRSLVRSTYRITPQSAERSLARAHEMFRKVQARLAEGREYLVAERFTAADLTFCALAAPMLLPPQCRAVQPTLEQVPPRMRDEIARLRESAAGQFALRLFERERDRSASGIAANPNQ
jgi:glutathione S-transferase